MVVVLLLLQPAEIRGVVKAPAAAKASSSSSAAKAPAAAVAEAVGEAGDAAAEESRHLEGALDRQELGPDGRTVQGGDAVVGEASCCGKKGKKKKEKKSYEFFFFPLSKKKKTLEKLSKKRHFQKKKNAPSANSQKAYPFEFPVLLSITRLNAASLP